MKTLHKTFWAVLALMVTLTATSCKKDGNGDKKEDEKEEGLVTREATIDAKSGSTVYYSLETGKTVSSNQNWDISFNKKLTSLPGETPPALGGIYLNANVEGLSTDQKFNMVTTAPTSGYAKDDEMEKVFQNWFDYDPLTSTISPSDRVYIIKTGGGKYAKLQITAFSSDGVFTIKYVIQLDGSLNLKE